jgi:hypothetical protein
MVLKNPFNSIHCVFHKMPILWYMLFTTILAPAFYQAQMIDNSSCHAFTDEPFFDPIFIRQNKIKRINGSVSTKGELQMIKSRDLVSNYEFDSLGRLVLQLGSFSTMGNKDTVINSYIYDSLGRIITKRTNDTYGFFSNNFVYDSENRVQSNTYCREENVHKNRYTFELAKQYIIIKETYKYSKNDSVLVKYIHNNHERLYQQQTYHYNKLRLLVAEENQYIINHKRSLIEYTYTDLGLVASKTIYRDYNNKENFERTEYRYDNLGNLEYIEEYKNDKHILHKEVLYDKVTYMVKALLVQDKTTNIITIVKFQIEFYP